MPTLAESAYDAIFVHDAQSEAAGCLTGASAWGSSAFSHRTPKLRSQKSEALGLRLRRRLRKRIDAEENAQRRGEGGNRSLGPDAEVSLAPLSAEWRGTSFFLKKKRLPLYIPTVELTTHNRNYKNVNDYHEWRRPCKRGRQRGVKQPLQE